MKKDSLSERFCPIARASFELADGWTFVILRELFMGNGKYDQLQQQTGINPRSLSNRLIHLAENGIVVKHLYSERPQRHEYHLTQKGQELWPLLMMMKSWGERWSDKWSEEDPPMRLRHGKDGHQFYPEITCRTCGEPVTAGDLRGEISQKMLQDRKHMACLNKR